MPRARLFSPLAALAAACPLLVAQDQPQTVPVDAFTVPEGLEVRLWAESPLLHNPTNMDVDHRGRVWVTEGVNYRGHEKRRAEGDRVVVLWDADGDGVADQSRCFVQDPHLVSPLGIAVFDNVVVVSQPPDLLVYTDVDRDLRFDPAVDTREVRLTGFGGRNHDHSLHSVTAGPDGRWYWNAGNCGAMFTDKSGRTFRIASPYADPHGVAGQPSDDGHVYIGGFTARMDPDGANVEIIGHNYRNSYEQVVTSFGDVFQSDNDDPPACRVTHVIEYGNAGFASRDGKRSWRADQRRGQSTQIAEWRQEDPGTMPAGDVYGGGSPTGVAFYENGALGEQWSGLLLTCEPGRNTVFGYLPKRSGAGFELERFDWMTSNPEHAFVGSDFTGGRWDGKLHTQFRPSDVCVGPDGAVYVADWFDGRVGGHQTLDDSLSGAIYRVAPEGFVSKAPTIDIRPVSELTAENADASCAGVLEALASPAVNVRHLGVRAILQGHPGNPLTLADRDDANAYVVARALWLLPTYANDKARDTIAMTATSDPNPERRLVAFRALRAAGHDVLELASELCRDEAPFVRAAVATAMRDAPAAQAVPILVAIGERFDGEDRSYLDAFGIGCTGKQSQVYAQLFADTDDATKWTQAQEWLAWRLGAPESAAALAGRARCGELSAEQRDRALTALAFVRHEDAMRAMVALAQDEAFELRGEAITWCLNRMDNEWAPFGLRALLQQTGVYDPNEITLVAVRTPPAPEHAPDYTVADVLALAGDATRGGLRAGACYTCHRIGDTGVEFGPDLTAFGRAQSREAITDAILHPSKSISHGFEGHTIETADGDIDGIVLSHGDPVVVQSQGGLVQLVPRSRIVKMRRMDRSLMWPPQLFGLDAQAMADLVAFLQKGD